MLFTRRSGGEREHIEAKRPESSRECAAGIRGDMQQKLGDRMAGTAGSKPRTSAAAVSGQCVCGRVRLEIGYPAFWAWHNHSQITRHAAGSESAEFQAQAWLKESHVPGTARYVPPAPSQAEPDRSCGSRRPARVRRQRGQPLANASARALRIRPP